MVEKRSGSDRRHMERRRTGVGAYQAYGQKVTEQKREGLVKKNLKLVSYIVSRLAIGLPSWIDKRDLISAGVIGLIDASKQYNPTMGTVFESYAATRIRGAILDELRRMDWVPRSIREKSKQVQKVISQLTEKNGRFPSDGEVADSLGWDMDRYYRTINEISGTTLLSLDEIITSSSGNPVTRLDAVQETSESQLGKIEKKELLDRMVKVIGQLTEQERLVIALYYYEELTLKEIGLVLKVSESRVSQIHTTAILKIRARLNAMYS
ncbi:FliA/WhiG family RNA polymerase sigma factor [Candidatus Latescibacterota bacterium]